MDKTIAYWIEKKTGLFLGILFGWLIYKHWNVDSTLNMGKYYDIILKTSSSLFGFLLTILALTINGTNSNMLRMKENDSFVRLIKYHKVAVLLAFCLIIYSILMYSIVEPCNGFKDFKNNYGLVYYKLLVAIHVGISVWTAVDTIMYVLIFYKIILTGNKK